MGIEPTTSRVLHRRHGLNQLCYNHCPKIYTLLAVKSNWVLFITQATCFREKKKLTGLDVEFQNLNISRVVPSPLKFSESFFFSFFVFDQISISRQSQHLRFRSNEKNLKWSWTWTQWCPKFLTPWVNGPRWHRLSNCFSFYWMHWTFKLGRFLFLGLPKIRPVSRTRSEITLRTGTFS